MRRSGRTSQSGGLNEMWCGRSSESGGWNETQCGRTSESEWLE